MRKRIAIFRNISHQIPPIGGYGGTDRGVYQLCQRLSERDHECHVFCSISPQLSSLQNVKTHSIFSASGRPSSKEEHAQYELLNRQHFDFALARFSELDEQNPFDVINVRVDSQYLLSNLLTSFGSKRLIYSLHNVPSKSIGEFVNNPAIVCTAHTPTHKRLHGDGENILVVPYGVEFSSCSGQVERDPRFPQPYLLSLGAIGPHKGTLSAINIANICGLPLVIAGVPFDPRGESVENYFAEVMAACNQMGGTFVGEANELEKISLIKHAEVVLFCSGFEDSSWAEPFGRVAAEAGLLGTPVVAFNCPSIHDVVIGGKTGEFFHSIEQAQEAVKRCRTMDRNSIAAESARHFSTSVFVDTFLEVCKIVISKQNHSAFNYEDACTS